MTSTRSVPSRSPERATAVLACLIFVAVVANLNLTVANVALPDIGRELDASQTQLNLIAVAYSLGLAASVVYLGAIGDRYGRKQVLVAGMALSIPAAALAGAVADPNVLFLARLAGGIAAGLSYPTTLALITALWSGPPRTRAIAAWSAFGGGTVAAGPVLAGLLLAQFYWGSVFLVTIPLAALALVAAVALLPAHVDESDAPVDHLGGAVSVLFVAALVLAINFAPVQGAAAVTLVLGAIAVLAGIAFLWRQRSVANPLYDLTIARRRIFWVAACAGIVVFGALMGVSYVGAQYLQNVLGYSTVAAGVAVVPAALAMIVVAPSSAKLVEARGARFTLLCGYAAIGVGLLLAIVFWRADAPYWQIAVSFVFLGGGVGLAGTPASRSLTGAVPVRRAGMASATADLQRDFGGAILQSVLGALLTAGYVGSLDRQIAGLPNSDQVAPQTQAALTKSFASAADLASRYPQYREQIMDGARTAFLHGDRWAIGVALLIVCAGAMLVAFAYPRHDAERELLARYAADDASQRV